MNFVGFSDKEGAIDFLYRGGLNIYTIAEILNKASISEKNVCSPTDDEKCFGSLFNNDKECREYIYSSGRRDTGKVEYRRDIVIGSWHLCWYENIDFGACQNMRKEMVEDDFSIK